MIDNSTAKEFYEKIIIGMEKEFGESIKNKISWHADMIFPKKLTITEYEKMRELFIENQVYPGEVNINVEAIRIPLKSNKKKEIGV